MFAKNSEPHRVSFRLQVFGVRTSQEGLVYVKWKRGMLSGSTAESTVINNVAYFNQTFDIPATCAFDVNSGEYAVSNARQMPINPDPDPDPNPDQETLGA